MFGDSDLGLAKLSLYFADATTSTGVQLKVQAGLHRRIAAQAAQCATAHCSPQHIPEDLGLDDEEAFLITTELINTVY
nr:hypothetical protein CFP56_66020 [Quercus suber]